MLMSFCRVSHFRYRMLNVVMLSIVILNVMQQINSSQVWSRLLALGANIALSYKGLAGANALAYFAH